MYKWTPIMSTLLEAGYDHVKDQASDKTNHQYKVTLAQQWQAGNNQWARPAIRLYQAWGKGKDEPQIHGHHPATYNEMFAEPGEVFCRVYYLDGRVAEFRKPAPFLIAGE
jgi:maltoporin